MGKAVERYRRVRHLADPSRTRVDDCGHVSLAAEAAIAELEAERDALKTAKQASDEAYDRMVQYAASLECCGNCWHIEVERIHGHGYMAQDQFELQCDTFFPDGEWGESGGWVGGSFAVTTFDSPCHFTPSRWERRQP